MWVTHKCFFLSLICHSKIYYVYIDSDKGWNDRGRFLPSDPFQLIQPMSNEKEKIKIYSTFLFQRGSFGNRGRSKKKTKNITTLLVRLSSVKRVPVAKEKGVEGAFPWRDEIVAARLETFPPNALDLSPLSPSFLHPRTPSSGQGVRREKKGRATERWKKTKRDTRRCNMREYVYSTVWSSVAVYIFARFSAGAERETRANGRETSFCQAHPPLNINRVGWVSRVLLLSVRFGVKGEREKGKGVNSEATPLPEKC